MSCSYRAHIGNIVSEYDACAPQLVSRSKHAASSTKTGVIALLLLGD